MAKLLGKWYQNVSIKRKLYFVVGIMALLIAVELFTLWFSIRTLSSVRAYVVGESLWSKAQKDAVYYLQKFGHTRSQKDYEHYKEFLKIPKGDALAREELKKETPDPEVARQGLLDGKNHPDDIGRMMWLFRNFREVHYIKKAIIAWEEGEPYLNHLVLIGERLHGEINSRNPSAKRIDALLEQIGLVNQHLTIHEDEFSYTLGEGSRWLENLILKILFVIALTVEFTGLYLTMSVTMSISKGISAIVKASDKVAEGDLTVRAEQFSQDEIGQLAQTFNNMVSDLDKRIKQAHLAEANLKIQKKELEIYSQKLEQSNKELQQFAYVASHDLREPLRTISSYVQLLQQRYQEKLDSEADEFIGFVTDGVNRMDTLITDLLVYSRLNTQELPAEWIDCNDLAEAVLVHFKSYIEEVKAKIELHELPVIYAKKQHMQQVFTNLVGNALKFHSPDRSPEVKIKVEEEEHFWKFSVSDNGIGIERKYADRIFVIFQRLNSRELYGGTGIGLTICKKIVEQHEGQIWFDSEPDKGTVFYFTIKKPDPDNPVWKTK